MPEGCQKCGASQEEIHKPGCELARELITMATQRLWDTIRSAHGWAMHDLARIPIFDDDGKHIHDRWVWNVVWVSEHRRLNIPDAKDGAELVLKTTVQEYVADEPQPEYVKVDQ